MKVRGARGQEHADNQAPRAGRMPPRTSRTHAEAHHGCPDLAVDEIGRWGGCHASDPLRVQRIDPWSSGDIRLVLPSLPARICRLRGEDTR